MPGVAALLPALSALTYTPFEATYTRSVAQVKEEPRWDEGDQSHAATTTCLQSYRFACHQPSAKLYDASQRLMARLSPISDAKRSLATWRLVRKTWWRHDDLTTTKRPGFANRAAVNPWDRRPTGVLALALVCRPRD
jgi:hypothetical protein